MTDKPMQWVRKAAAASPLLPGDHMAACLAIQQAAEPLLAVVRRLDSPDRSCLLCGEKVHWRKCLMVAALAAMESAHDEARPS